MAAISLPIGRARTLESQKKVRHSLLVPFVYPGHLDGFEDLFVGAFGVVVEAGQRADPFVQIGEAQVDVVGLGMRLLELDGDVDSTPTVG
jgi:hypothetical protein